MAAGGDEEVGPLQGHPFLGSAQVAGKDDPDPAQVSRQPVEPLQEGWPLHEGDLATDDQGQPCGDFSSLLAPGQGFQQQVLALFGGEAGQGQDHGGLGGEGQSPGPLAARRLEGGLGGSFLGGAPGNHDDPAWRHLGIGLLQDFSHPLGGHHQVRTTQGRCGLLVEDQAQEVG